MNSVGGCTAIAQCSSSGFMPSIVPVISSPFASKKLASSGVNGMLDSEKNSTPKKATSTSWEMHSAKSSRASFFSS